MRLTLNARCCPQSLGVTIACCLFHCYYLVSSYLCCKMSEWVPSTVMEVKLLRLMEKGRLPPKVVAGWRAATGDAFLLPRLDEAVTFIDFHEQGLMILASDFLSQLPP